MPTNEQLPGINALGCGFDPFDSTVTKYRRRLFDFDFAGDSEPWTGPARAGSWRSPDGRMHSVPKGVMISPEGSSGESLAEVFESRRDVESKFAASAKVSGGYGLFRASFAASYAVDQSRTSEYSFATKRYANTLWSLGLDTGALDLKNHVGCEMRRAVEALPKSFCGTDPREPWDAFFRDFGTHYIAGCAVGGTCELTVAVTKTTQMTSEKIAGQVDIEYGAFFKGEGSAALEKLDKAYAASHRHWETLRGGDTSLAGQLQTDAAALTRWSESVKTAPVPRDFVLRGIWELISDPERAKACEEAFLDYCYRNSNYSLKVTGTGSFFDVERRSGLDSFGDVTFEAWIYPTGDGTGAQRGGIILNKEYSYEIARAKDGSIEWALAVKRPGWTWTGTGHKAPKDRWSHVALVVDAKKGIVTGYLDGNPGTRTPLEGALKATEYKLRFGGRPQLTQDFEGYFEEIRIWTVARSADEIQADMNRRLTGAEPNLVGLWSLNDATGDRARDRSPSDNGGVLRNAHWEEPPVASPVTVRMHSQSLDTPAIRAAVASETCG